MKRMHLIELHEQPWYPERWRRLFQQGLSHSLQMTGAYRNIVEPFRRYLERTGARSFLDLCSGAADPMVQLREGLRELEALPPDLKFYLSDLYPDTGRFERIKSRYPDAFEYVARPVDALDPPPGLPRYRTMFTALHHFRPEDVRKILSDAAENADGIAVFEATGRTVPSMLATVPIPFAAAIVTAFVLRPWSPWNVIWGLLVPVLPLTAFWDGIVSNLRTYTVEELRALTDSIAVPDFKWQVGTVPMPGPPGLEATYLFGWRERSAPLTSSGEPSDQKLTDRETMV